MDQSPTRSRSPPRQQPGSDPDSPQYWCYHCDKRVSVETLADLPDVICFECKNGFVESISSDASPRAAADPIDDPNFGSQVIQVLRLMAHAAAREPPPPPTDPSYEDDLRIELGFDSDDDDEDDDEGDEDEDERSVEVHEDGVENRDASDGDEEEEDTEVTDERVGEDDDEEEMRRRRLRLRLNDFLAQAVSRRNRILDWAEILMGLEDHSIELRLQVPRSDNYVGNPGNYVDAAGYQALLHNLAEIDNSGRRGAPPAGKAAIEGLDSVIIDKEGEVLVCAICKDSVNVGELAKKLPCGHGYHGECIVPWLGSRNSCPVCRFELPTDDPEYEEERKKRVVMSGLRADSTGSSSVRDSGF